MNPHLTISKQNWKLVMDSIIILVVIITSVIAIAYLINISQKEKAGTKGIPEEHKEKDKDSKNDREDFIV